MSEKGPIGIFDSGYGGLTVLKEIREQLPQYDYLYLGDNARAPYGPRSFEVIYEYTWQAVQALFEQGCSLVILACNTASAKALRSIQQKQLPLLSGNKRVLGVIRPSTEALGEMTISKHIGILATEGTVKSESYLIELQKFAPEITVTQHACPMWVPLIENNQQTTPGGIYFLQQDLLSLLQQDPKIDTILLGCTHYPLVKETLESLLPPHIQVVAQGSLVATKLENYLQRHPEIESLCQKGGNVTYVTTESASDFSINASRIMGLSIDAKHITLH
ncbi:MAG: glutamate racemase [Fluviicola sp.]|nr:glutamate racemase [Fluviicola sp.]